MVVMAAQPCLAGLTERSAFESHGEIRGAAAAHLVKRCQVDAIFYWRDSSLREITSLWISLVPS